MGKVIVAKGCCTSYQVCANTKTQITAFGCICANSSFLPPGFIFPGKRTNLEYGLSIPEDSFMAFTDKGYMETDKFYYWLSNCFAPNVAVRPVLLLLDGHDSHVDVHTSEFAQANNILLYALPLHTSHLTQPLDVAVFSPLKGNWKIAVKSFIDKTRCAVTKMTFGRVFMDAWIKTMCMKTIISGFRKSGTWPVNFAEIDLDKCGPSKVFSRDLETEERILAVEQTTETSVEEDGPTSVEEDGSDKENDAEVSLVDDPLRLRESLPDLDISGVDEITASPPLKSKLTPTNKTPITSKTKNKSGKSLSPAFAFHLTYPGTPKKKDKKTGRVKTSQLPSNLSGEIAVNLLKKKREDRKNAEKLKMERQKQREENRIRKEKELQRKKMAQDERKRNDGACGSDKTKKSVGEKSMEEGNSKKKWKGEPVRKVKRTRDECEKCGGRYTKGKEIWICCGDEENDTGCALWFHLKCTDVDQGINEEALEKLLWYCEACLDEYQ